MGIADEQPEVSDTIRDLLAYLNDNPDAQDTLEGIVEWWLLERRIHHGIAKVKDTLKRMVESGLLVEHQAADGHIRYSINDRRRDEISRLLDEEED